MGDDPNMRGNSRLWLTAAVEHSLRRLNIDHIDLYQVHRPDPDTDIEETLGVLTDLVRAGKIRYFGCSTFRPHRIVQAQWASREHRLVRFVTEQPPYSLLVRGIEADLLPVARDYRMGVISWSPLAGGWLSGTFSRRHPEPGRRGMARQRRVRRCEKIAAPLGGWMPSGGCSGRRHRPAGPASGRSRPCRTSPGPMATGPPRPGRRPW